MSPDSDRPWAAEGAWPAAPGVYRIPVPLPDEGLRAVNVYALETGAGLVLVDGGWARPGAAEVLDRALRSIGYRLEDVSSFLVTHAHRDHYTLARTLGSRLDRPVALGIGERPALRALQQQSWHRDPLVGLLEDVGANELAERIGAREFVPHDRDEWADPDRWLEGEVTLELGTRSVDAVPTPGHTAGHYVFAEHATSLLFSGDHVLPTMTPSVGYAIPRPTSALGDFLASLTTILQLPDLEVLPAHGPTGTCSHARARQLLDHHEARLGEIVAVLTGAPTGVVEVAEQLSWTRRELALPQLELAHQALAVLETEVHLELLVAQGRAIRSAALGRPQYSLEVGRRPAPGR